MSDLQAAVDAWVASVVELGYVQAWGPLHDRQVSAMEFAPERIPRRLQPARIDSGGASCQLQPTGNVAPASQAASCDPSARAGEQEDL